VTVAAVEHSSWLFMSYEYVQL